MGYTTRPMIPVFIDRSQIPHQPGVYIYKDNRGRILYVGKAIDLYHRVASYFHASSQEESPKTKALVERIAGVKTIVVESELEALILEANLIQKYLPPFNIRLTDENDYLYIAVTDEDFPKIITARKKDLPAGRQGLGKEKKYWGPFPSSRTVRETLKSLRRVFPWCSNFQSRFVDSKPNRDRKRRPCFYYHIGLCPGVCAGLVTKEDYAKIISRFSKFMDGKKEELVSQLTKEMLSASENRRFEEAAKIKKILGGIVYMTQPNRTKLYLENPNFLEDERRLALEELKKELSLEKLPRRVEGYDISNISGQEATGSMVVLTHGEIDKSQYRKFKINISGKPNDVGMHREMMRRRLRHKEWPMPDLILIDGGRGQVRGVCSELQSVNCRIPIFGLAKRMEWLYPPEGEILKLSKKSPALKLLQKLRDEAHRFAVTYHRKLHGRILLGIPSTSLGNIR